MSPDGGLPAGCAVGYPSDLLPVILKLLLVDDNQSVLDATELILTRAGYSVEATTDVFGLALKVGSLKPDAVLLDVDLPAMSGDALAVSLKKVRSSKDCKIIFHSAEDEDKLRRLVVATGVTGYIPKGLSRAEFLQRLGHFLEQK